MSEKEILKKAEEYEDAAKLAKREKKYSLAITYYRKAIDEYKKAGKDGMVGFLQKEISRIVTLAQFLGIPINLQQQERESKEFQVIKGQDLSGLSPIEQEKRKRIELEKKASNIESRIKKLLFDEDYNGIVEAYQELKKIYEELGYEFQARKVNFQIEKYTDLARQKALREIEEGYYYQQTKKTIAQEREERIKREEELRKRLESERMERLKEEEAKRKMAELEHRKAVEERLLSKKKAQMEQFSEYIPESYSDENERKRREWEEKQRKLREQKEREQRILNDANRIMDIAKKLVDEHEYDLAKEKYKQSAELFKEIGWTQQAQILLNEIANIEEMKRQYLERLKREEEKRKKEEQLFQERARKIQEEIERQKRLEEERRNQLPKEIRLKIERAEMLLKKADKNEHKGQYPMAYSRYKYALELFTELKPVTGEKYDCEQKIELIEQKLKELKPFIMEEEINANNS